MTIVNVVSNDQFRTMVVEAQHCYVWIKLHSDDGGRYIEVKKAELLNESNMWGGPVKINNSYDGNLFLGVAV